MKRATFAVGISLLMLAVGCRQSQAPNVSGGQAGDRSVVVYSSADKEFAELIFRAYEQKTGVKVLPLYDTEETKTAGLTARLVAEKDHPKADVFKHPHFGWRSHHARRNDRRNNWKKDREKSGVHRPSASRGLLRG